MPVNCEALCTKAECQKLARQIEDLNQQLSDLETKVDKIDADVAEALFKTDANRSNIDQNYRQIQNFSSTLEQLQQNFNQHINSEVPGAHGSQVLERLKDNFNSHINDFEDFQDNFNTHINADIPEAHEFSEFEDLQENFNDHINAEVPQSHGSSELEQLQDNFNKHITADIPTAHNFREFERLQDFFNKHINERSIHRDTSDLEAELRQTQRNLNFHINATPPGVHGIDDSGNTDSGDSIGEEPISQSSIGTAVAGFLSSSFGRAILAELLSEGIFEAVQKFFSGREDTGIVGIDSNVTDFPTYTLVEIIVLAGKEGTVADYGTTIRIPKAVGIDGRDGRDGRDGEDGKDGKDGRDGRDGEDGTKVEDINLNFDSSATSPFGTTHVDVELQTSEGKITTREQLPQFVQDIDLEQNKCSGLFSVRFNNGREPRAQDIDFCYGNAEFIDIRTNDKPDETLVEVALLKRGDTADDQVENFTIPKDDTPYITGAELIANEDSYDLSIQRSDGTEYYSSVEASSADTPEELSLKELGKQRYRLDMTLSDGTVLNSNAIQIDTVESLRVAELGKNRFRIDADLVDGTRLNSNSFQAESLESLRVGGVPEDRTYQIDAQLEDGRTISSNRFQVVAPESDQTTVESVAVRELSNAIYRVDLSLSNGAVVRSNEFRVNATEDTGADIETIELVETRNIDELYAFRAELNYSDGARVTSNELRIEMKCDLQPVLDRLRDVTKDVDYIRRQHEIDINGEVPIGDCQEGEIRYSYAPAGVQGYNGSGFQLIKESVDALAAQNERIHKDVCAAVLPAKEIELPDVDIQGCQEDENGNLQLTSVGTNQAAINPFLPTIAGGLASAIASFLIDKIFNQQKEVMKALCKRYNIEKEISLQKCVEDDQGNVELRQRSIAEIKAEDVYGVIDYLDIIKQEIDLTKLEVCKVDTESDLVTIVAAPEEQHHIKGKVLVIDFVTEENYPKRKENSSKWRIQVPNPKENIDWCGDLDNIRWQRGREFHWIKYKQYQHPVTGWFRNKVDADNFFNSINNLTVEKEEYRRFSNGEGYKVQPEVVVARPYRAYVAIISSDDGEPIEEETIKLEPPKGGCE
jgi:hypothetical protein